MRKREMSPKEGRINTEPQETTSAFISKLSEVTVMRTEISECCKIRDIHGSGNLLMVERAPREVKCIFRLDIDGIAMGSVLVSKLILLRSLVDHFAGVALTSSAFLSRQATWRSACCS